MTSEAGTSKAIVVAFDATLKAVSSVLPPFPVVRLIVVPLVISSADVGGMQKAALRASLTSSQPTVNVGSAATGIVSVPTTATCRRYSCRGSDSCSSERVYW